MYISQISFSNNNNPPYIVIEITNELLEAQKLILNSLSYQF